MVVKAGDIGRLNNQATATGTDDVLTLDSNQVLVKSSLNVIGSVIGGGLTNVVDVTSLSDFPTPSVGIITLEAKTYLITGNVNIGNNQLSLIEGSEIRGFCPTRDILQNTSVAAFGMISCIDINACVNNIGLISNDATAGIFHSDTSGNKTLTIDNVTFSGTRFVQAEGSGKLSINGFEVTSSTTPSVISLLNNGGDVLISNGKIGGIAASAASLLLGSSTWDTLTVNNVNFDDVAAGKTAISGAVSNGNINSGGKGRIASCRFNGVGTVLAGITVGDTRWATIDNISLPDSQIIGELSMLDNAVETTISAVDTYTKILGTTTAGSENQRFSMPSNNRLRYDGIEDTVGIIMISLLGERTTGTGLKDWEFTIFKNGSIMNANIVMQPEISGARLQAVLFASTNLSTNDFFEVFVQNVQDDNNITCQTLLFQIIGQI